MLPKEVWSLAKIFTFNLHASLIPNYRGAAPINWVIINGEKNTGLTTFIIDDNIDTGLVLLKEEINIDYLETVFSLSNKLLNKAGPLIKKTIDFYFFGKLDPKKQVLNGTEKFAPKLTPENIKIDWKESIDIIERKIRGLSPLPGAWTFFKNGNIKSRMKILESSIIYLNHKNELNKIIIKDGSLFISLNEGYLKCTEIQIENKKKMSTKSLLNGYKFSENSFVLEYLGL
jgi:methionyl-tRNA formyltransferase